MRLQNWSTEFLPNLPPPAPAPYIALRSMFYACKLYVIYKKNKFTGFCMHSVDGAIAK